MQHADEANGRGSVVNERIVLPVHFRTKVAIAIEHVNVPINLWSLVEEVLVLPKHSSADKRVVVGCAGGKIERFIQQGPGSLRKLHGLGWDYGTAIIKGNVESVLVACALGEGKGPVEIDLGVLLIISRGRRDTVGSLLRDESELKMLGFGSV